MCAQRVVSILTTGERGGAEYATVDLLDALVARGHDVALLTNVPDVAAGTSVPVRAIEVGPKLSRRSVRRVVAEAPRTLLRLRRALGRERPVGVLLLHFKKEQILCALLPRRVTGRVVWAEWGPLPPPLRSNPARLAYLFAARRTDGIMAVSEGTRRTLVDAGVPGRKVVVVPNLVDVDEVAFDPASRTRLRAEWGAGGDTLVAGCISRFQRRKRNDVVVDAAGLLGGDTLVVLAGEGEEEAALRERAAPHGDRIRFVPNVRGHVAEFLSACDVLVFAPSPTEGAPRVIVMAQLVGVPVVSTGAEGAEEMVPPGTGIIASPDHDPRAVAAAIEAYRDGGRRRADGAAGRTLALERYAPERTLRAVESVLGLA